MRSSLSNYTLLTLHEHTRHTVGLCIAALMFSWVNYRPIRPYNLGACCVEG